MTWRGAGAEQATTRYSLSRFQQPPAVADFLPLVEGTLEPLRLWRHRRRPVEQDVATAGGRLAEQAIIRQ
jgi:hypothetical protein